MTACSRSAGSTLPAAVERTLQRTAHLRPAAVRRARKALRGIFASINGSAWPETACRFSRLTNTGLPMDFAWSSRDPALRWTAEVAPPETPYASRLPIAAGLAGIRRDLEEWTRLQDRATLRYGAWLGMRHREADEQDEAKVYLELPGRLPDRRRRQHVVFRAEGLRWRMAGLYPDGTVEFYARADGLDARQLTSLETACFSARGYLVPAVLALARSEQLPPASSLSVSVGEDGCIGALTWFGFASAIFNNDDAALAALNVHADSDEAQALHTALTGTRPDGRWRHGFIGVGTSGSGLVWVQTSIRPS